MNMTRQKEAMRRSQRSYRGCSQTISTLLVKPGMIIRSVSPPLKT
jgi:hypothetical protein